MKETHSTAGSGSRRAWLPILPTSSSCVALSWASVSLDYKMGRRQTLGWPEEGAIGNARGCQLMVKSEIYNAHQVPEPLMS